MPSGLWEVNDNGETKFASMLANGKDFKLLSSALDEEVAQIGLLKNDAQAKTMLELALHRFMNDYLNQNKIAKLIIKLINACPEVVKVSSYYECPPLHYAAKKLNYSTFKMLLRAKNADPNFADNNGLHIWHYLFDREKEERFRDFIYVLIKHPKFDIKKNKQSILVEARMHDDIREEQLLEIEEFLDVKEKEKELFATKAWPPTYWVKSFDLVYFRGDQRHQKEDLMFDCNNPHLKLKAFQTLAATRLGKDAVQNVASAIITFIISYTTDNKTYVTDHNITIGEDYYNYTLKFMDDSNYAQYLQNELAEYFGKDFFVNNLETWKVVKKEEIASENASFNVRFKHSEQALFLYIRKNISKILKELRGELEMLGFDKRNPTFKIKAAVLNIFSERYMCQHCQAMALAFQKPSAFIEPLINEALRLGFKDNRYSDVKFTIMVSANTPLVKQADQRRIEEFRISENEHSQVEIDIKTLPSGHIFFKDVSKVDIPLTAFFISSSKNITDQHKRLESENQRLRENEQKSQEEKKHLLLTNRKLQKTIEALRRHFGDESVTQNELESNKSNNQQSASSAATATRLDNPEKSAILTQPNNKKRDRVEQQSKVSEMRAPKPKIPKSETNTRFTNTTTNNHSFVAATTLTEASYPYEVSSDLMDYNVDPTNNLDQSYQPPAPK